MSYDRRTYAKPQALVYECRNGREISLKKLPIKMQVCPTCDGRGKYVNPAIDENGLSPEDFQEDPDFKESYFRGDYDIMCGECHGRNVVEAIDEDALHTSSQKRLYKMFCSQQEERAKQAREDRNTEYWESGGMSGCRY